MHVAPLADGRDDLADVVPVLQHGVANLQVAQRDLVAEGHGVERRHRHGLVGLHDPAGDVSFPG